MVIREEIEDLAMNFEACHKTLASMRDETRQHIILEMMRMDYSGKLSFDADCIGCLSCVQLCPKAAIDIGNITKKRERFPNKQIKPAELTEKVIHMI